MRKDSRRIGGAAAYGLALLAVVACSGDPGTGPAPRPSLDARTAPSGPSAQAVPGAYVVTLRQPGAQTASVAAAARALGARVTGSIPEIGVVALGEVGARALAALRENPSVESVVPDYLVQWIPEPTRLQFGSPRAAERGPAAEGTDQSGAFFFPFQWNMRLVRADQAWVPTPAGAGQLACILDTGIDPAHIDLAGKVDLAKSTYFVSAPLFPGDLSIIDYNFHGSHVAGIVSSNGIGVASVAPDAQLCAIKVLRVSGSGLWSDILEGMAHAARVGAAVANMSLGAYFDRTLPGAPQLIAAMERMVRYGTNLGTLYVAAAGNNGADLDADGDFISIPAEINGVLTVGAVGPIGQTNFTQRAHYSNFGRAGIEVFAPGGEYGQPGSVVPDLVLSVCSSYQLTLPFECDVNSFVFAAGTSMAAPHVTGGALVLKSVRPPLSPITLERCVRRTAMPLLPESIFNSGLLDVLALSRCTINN